MNLVDSSAWLAYFADEPNADLFAEAIEDQELLIVPTVCLYEVFKAVCRQRGEDDALLAIAAMQSGQVIDLTADLALEAAVVGADENLAFADAIIYATAKRSDATLWTQDAHFQNKPGVQFHPKQ